MEEKQYATINAGSQKEFERRIQELIDRGFKVDFKSDPKTQEFRHYTYQTNSRNIKRSLQGFDIQQKFTAKMSRVVDK